jgi:hypothetical protein
VIKYQEEQKNWVASQKEDRSLAKFLTTPSPSGKKNLNVKSSSAIAASSGLMP